MWILINRQGFKFGVRRRAGRLAPKGRPEPDPRDYLGVAPAALFILVYLVAPRPLPNRRVKPINKVGEGGKP